MWPLLQKDGLAAPYLAVIALYNCFMGYNPFRRSAKVSLVRRFSQASLYSMSETKHYS